MHDFEPCFGGDTAISSASSTAAPGNVHARTHTHIHTHIHTHRHFCTNYHSFAATDAEVKVGEPSVWTITVKDVNGNGVLTGGAKVDVRVDGVAVDPQALVVDNGDGTYTATFTTTASGSYDVHVTVNGEELAASPFTAVVYAGAFSPAKSIVFGPATQRPTAVDVATSFMVGARDEFGNDILVGSFPFNVVVVSAPTTDPIVFRQTELNNGTTRFTFTPRVAGQYVLSVLSNMQFVGSVISVSAFANDAMSGIFSASRSYVAGAGLVRAASGVPARFTIQVTINFYYYFRMFACVRACVLLTNFFLR